MVRISIAKILYYLLDIIFINYKRQKKIKTEIIGKQLFIKYILYKCKRSKIVNFLNNKTLFFFKYFLSN